jgi:hypothetical protein
MTKKTDDVLTTAKERFAYAIERSEHNRAKAKADMRFLAATPDDPWQWDEVDLNSRKTSARPTLTINKLPQHVRQVTNDIRQNRPSIRYRPADSKADVEVADILMGIVRHIEANSDADVAYDAAADHQVTHGTGYIRVLTDYVSAESFDQDIFIRQIDDPLKVVDDPDALDPAGADRKFAFIEDSLTEEEFKRQFPKAEPIDWAFDGADPWFNDKKIRIAEYFELCHREKRLLLWANGSTSFEDEPMPAGVYAGEVPIKQRMAQQPYVKWRKLNGKEILEESEFPCRHIPLARAWGNHYVIDGKVYVHGLVRPAKDSQRMYNVAQSAIVERVMQAPKAPWTLPGEAVEGYEKHWQTANTANHAYLPWNHRDENGEPIPAPTRNMPTAVEPGLAQIAQGAADDIKAETGQYDASLGARSNETSGRAIMARQREGDMATYHYVDNLARAVRHIGRIILDMIPRIYDTQRVARILGEDGEAANAILDPKQPQPLQEMQGPDGKIQRIFNPGVGVYDVFTTTGPSFTSRRQEAVEAMSSMTQANPQLWQVIGDLLVKNMDWPGADEMAKRLKAVLLPAVQQADDENGPQIPPELQQAMEQMQQQMQAMQQAGAELQRENEQLKGDRDIELKKLLIDAYAKETDRIKSLGGAMSPEAVQALVMQTLQQVMTSPDPTPPPAMPIEPPPEMATEQITPAAMPVTGA